MMSKPVKNLILKVCHNCSKCEGFWSSTRLRTSRTDSTRKLSLTRPLFFSPIQKRYYLKVPVTFCLLSATFSEKRFKSFLRPESRPKQTKSRMRSLREFFSIATWQFHANEKNERHLNNILTGHRHRESLSLRVLKTNVIKAQALSRICFQ